MLRVDEAVTAGERAKIAIARDPNNLYLAFIQRHALKSGINAKAQVIRGEETAELEVIVATYHEDWQPATSLERFLVDSLVRADWLLRRFARVEAQLWAHHIQDARTSAFDKLDGDAPLGDIYSRASERFTRLQCRIDSAERALTQLQRLRHGW